MWVRVSHRVRDRIKKQRQSSKVEVKDEIKDTVGQGGWGGSKVKDEIQPLLSSVPCSSQYTPSHCLPHPRALPCSGTNVGFVGVLESVRLRNGIIRSSPPWRHQVLL